ncbi:hypothetical protein N0V88_007125 [Collariella sp. IMI 366227]|nr:hypothetical protein N0V88_007125 [Collariella sp. IMI 366227]
MINWNHEVQYLAQEVAAYQHLSKTTPWAKLAPEMFGYVYEVSPSRIIEILIEQIQGRPAGIAELSVVTAELEDLHQPLLHGDVCRYNIMVTDVGVRFIDLETTAL